jgi:hypothetical protein
MGVGLFFVISTETRGRHTGHSGERSAIPAVVAVRGDPAPTLGKLSQVAIAALSSLVRDVRQPDTALFAS